jgi:hypothetical protein
MRTRKAKALPPREIPQSVRLEFGDDVALVQEALALEPRVSFPAFVRAAVLTQSRRIVSSRKRTALLDNATPTERRGQFGAADGRIKAAYDALVAAGIPPSVSRLKRDSQTSIRTVKNWAGRLHPELLRQIPQRSTPLPPQVRPTVSRANVKSTI